MSFISASAAKDMSNGFYEQPFAKISRDAVDYWGRYINSSIKEAALRREFSITHQFRAIYTLDTRSQILSERIEAGRVILRNIIKYGEKLGYHIRLVDENNDWQPYIIIDWS